MADQNTAVKSILTDAVASEMLGKKWYTSKTLWVNVLAIVGIILQAKYGFLIDLEVQSLSLAAINMILRKITKEPVVW